MMAIRALKRRLSNVVYTRMLADQQQRELAREQAREQDQATGPGGQRGNDSVSSAAGSQPHTGSSDKPLPGPATGQPRTRSLPPLDLKGCHDRAVALSAA